MSIFDAIAPERATIFCPMDEQHDEVFGPELLSGDPYDPAYWTSVNNAVLSRQVGVYLGGDALRVAYGGPSTLPYAAKVLVDSNKRYRVSAALLNQGGTYAGIDVGNAVEAFSSAPAVFTAKTNEVNHGGDTRLILLALSVGPGEYADFAALSLKELRRVTRNMGQASGAPTWVQCGNGYTSTSFPSQRAPSGMNFDGTDYLTVAHADMPDLGNNFTIAALVNIRNATAAYKAIVDKSSGGNPMATPYMLWCDVDSRFRAHISNGAAQDVAASPAIGAGSNHFTACNCSDTQLIVYLNGAAGTPVVRTVNCVNNALPLVIGAASVGGGSPLNGDYMSGFAIYPYALNQMQLAELENRMRLNATRSR